MSEAGFAGVYQLENGYWGFRYAIVINGKRKEAKKLKNELGNPFKAAKAREIAIAQEKSKSLLTPQKKIIRQTVNVLSNIWTGIFQKLY